MLNCLAALPNRAYFLCKSNQRTFSKNIEKKLYKMVKANEKKVINFAPGPAKLPQEVQIFKRNGFVYFSFV